MDGNQTGYWLANSFLPISVFCEVKKTPILSILLENVFPVTKGGDVYGFSNCTMSLCKYVDMLMLHNSRNIRIYFRMNGRNHSLEI